MYRLIIISILICFTVSLSGQVSKPKFQYNSSYVSQVKAFRVTFNGSESTVKSDYWSLLNTGPYVAIDKVSELVGNTIVTLETLFLQPGINNLRLKYKDQDFPHEIVLVYPKLTINSVMQGSLQIVKNQSVYVINKNEEVTFSYTAEFPKIADPDPYAPQGSKTLTGIKYKFNNNNWDKAGKTGALKLNNFQEGENQLLIKYVNDAATEYAITYTDTVKIFFLDFELPESAWKEDTLIELQGKPEGGWFTGDGIVGNSNYFNPSLINDTTLITYNYPYYGTVLKSLKGIKVLEYDFTILGPLSVCSNSIALYTVSLPKDDFTYKWEVEYGISSLGTNNETDTIRWNRNIPAGVDFGKVTVTATQNTSFAVFKQTISVNLKKNKSYDPAELFFGDINKKLVICTKKDAYQYNWYVDDSPQAHTTQPYFDFNVPGQKYAAELVTEEGCVTKIEIKVSSSTGYSGQVVPQTKNNILGDPDFSNYLLVYPNPAINELNLVLTSPDNEISLRIFNNLSQKVYESKIEKGERLKNINLSDYPSGKYFIQVLYPDGPVSAQFIKIN